VKVDRGNTAIAESAICDEPEHLGTLWRKCHK